MEFPTDPLVAGAWAKTVAGVDAAKVSTTLPADAAVWAATGFVVATTVGGGGATGTALYGPVIRLDCWAANLNSNRPPWGRAESLAQRLIFAAYNHRHMDVELGDDFYPARLLEVLAVGRPIRVPGDEAGFARVYVDVQLHWTVTA